MSKGTRIQARHRVTDCSSQVPPGIHKSQNQKRQMWKITLGRQNENNKMRRRHLDAMSPIDPMRNHRDRLLSMLEEDDEVVGRLSLSVKLIPNLVRVEEHLKKTFGKLDLTNFPVNTATWCCFARDYMWASLKMSRWLSELFLLEYAGHTEHPDWKSS